MPGTVEALTVVLFVIAPRYLCWIFLGSRLPRAFISNTHTILNSLLLSLIVHVLASPASIALAPRIANLRLSLANAGRVESIPVDWVVFGWAFGVMILIPAVLALILIWLLETEWTQGPLNLFGVSKVHLMPTAWDWFFLTQKKGCWIVAELTDGSRVGGEYGENSFVSITPHKKDLFLESVYQVDEEHNFGEEMLDTIGCWINGDFVKALHVYHADEEAAA